MERWTPAREMAAWMNNWDRFFDEVFRDLSPATQADWVPAIDIREEKDKYVVTADLPGLRKEDVEVTFENDVLTITGERKVQVEQNDSRLHRSERYFGRFSRALRFPGDARPDQISATFKDGVLEVTVPKSEEAKARKIQVQ